MKSPTYNILMLGAFTLLATSSLTAVEPALEARFNDDVAAELFNGATLGAPGSGVSGLPSDRAYEATALETPLPNEAGPAAEIPKADGLSGLDELTITAWYKATTEPADTMTLFTLGFGNLIWDGRSSVWVLRLEGQPEDASDTKLMYWFPTDKEGSAAPWSTSGEWIYFAAVWSRANNNVLFYQGSKSTPTIQTKESTRPDEVLPLATLDGAQYIMGSNGGKMDRSFNGALDNVRVYTSALTSDALEQIRAADLKNESPNIP